MIKDEKWDALLEKATEALDIEFIQEPQSGKAKEMDYSMMDFVKYLLALMHNDD